MHAMNMIQITINFMQMVDCKFGPKTTNFLGDFFVHTTNFGFANLAGIQQNERYNNSNTEREKIVFQRCTSYNFDFGDGMAERLKVLGCQPKGLGFGSWWEHQDFFPRY